MDSARNNLLQQREQWRSAEMSLITDVVQAYTSVRQNEARVRLGAQNLENSRRSYLENQVKYEVGTTTVTDLKNAEAQYARQESTYLQQQVNLTNSRTSYLTTVGKMPESLQQEPDIASFLPKSFEEAYMIAQQNSPTIRQAYLNERNAAIALANAKAAYRPSANFNVGTNFAIGSRRFGNNAACNSAPCFENTTGSLTASVGITAPIWPGRAQASQVRTQEESYRAAQNTLDNARRTLYRTVSNGWNNLENARRQVEVQQKSVEAQRTSTLGEIEQNTQGITTLSQRLISEANLASAEQNAIDAQFSLFTTGVTFLQTIGTLSLDTFGVTGIDRYDPSEHFEQVNGRGTSGWAEWVENLDRTFGVRPPAYVPVPGEVIPEFERP
jgi:outer membrane protein TolC